MSSSQQRKVRVIAKVRGVTDRALAKVGSARSVSVHKPDGGDRSEFVSVSYGDQSAGQRDSYKLDNCYEEREGSGIVFTNEVKPMISGVFDGHDGTVIAYGAIGSGQTHLIQGSDNEPGLAVRALSEMLHIADGCEKSISVSAYEIFQDNVYDVLVSERPMVHLLEVQGTIQLKGLSRVPVKSVSEFQSLYFGVKKGRNTTKKMIVEPPRRSHKGLMIYVSSYDAYSKPLGKMNFVELAGYEDSRRKSIDRQATIETTKINKSIYGLLNVMYALNANESHVPYRESRLTRMLKDSLQGINRTLLIACLSPSFCQDSINMLNLASRSCQGNNRSISSSIKTTDRVAKTMMTSLQIRKKPLSVTTTANKQTTSRMKTTETKKKGSVMPSMKARKLFSEAGHTTKSQRPSKKGISSLEPVPSVLSSLAREESSTSAAVSSEAADTPAEDSFHKEEIYEETGPSVSDTIVGDLSSIEKDLTEDKENKSSVANKDLSTLCEDPTEDKENKSSVANKDPSSLCEEGQDIDKENNSLAASEAEPQPLSIQLQEVVDKLKSIYPSAPPCIQMIDENPAPSTPMRLEVCSNDIPADGINVEPRTPENSTLSNIRSSPWQTFTAHSSRAKNSLVDEYLRFLNTAEKEDLKKLKGIGEKRAAYIVDLRKESPEPFKSLNDMKSIGLSAKQIKGMLTKEVGELFD